MCPDLLELISPFSPEQIFVKLREEEIIESKGLTQVDGPATPKTIGKNEGKGKPVRKVYEVLP